MEVRGSTLWIQTGPSGRLSKEEDMSDSFNFDTPIIETKGPLLGLHFQDEGNKEINQTLLKDPHTVIECGGDQFHHHSSVLGHRSTNTDLIHQDSSVLKTEEGLTDVVMGLSFLKEILNHMYQFLTSPARLVNDNFVIMLLLLTNMKEYTLINICLFHCLPTILVPLEGVRNYM